MTPVKVNRTQTYKLACASWQVFEHWFYLVWPYRQINLFD